MNSSTPPEIQAEIEQVLDGWRKSILTILYRMCVGLGLFGFLVMFYTDASQNPEQAPALILYSVLYGIVVLMAFAPKINQRVRGWVFLLVIYGLAVLGLVRGGLAGDGRLFLLSLPVLATILIDLTAAATMTLLSLATLLVFSWLAGTRLLEPWFLWPLARIHSMSITG